MKIVLLPVLFVIVVVLTLFAGCVDTSIIGIPTPVPTPMIGKPTPVVTPTLDITTSTTDLNGVTFSYLAEVDKITVLSPLGSVGEYDRSTGVFTLLQNSGLNQTDMDKILTHIQEYLKSERIP
jgi:hypothetical protein